MQRLIEHLQTITYKLNRYQEENIRYILRCLNRMNRYDIENIRIIIDEYTSTIVYPYQNEETIYELNPMFCLGYHMKINYERYDHPIMEVYYINNIYELIGVLHK